LEQIVQWWRGLTPQQKAAHVSRLIVSGVSAAVGAKAKGPKGAVVAGGAGWLAHELLDVPVATLLLSLGLFAG